MDDFYIFLSSSDSTDLYPDNGPNSFTVNLRKNISLEGLWYVGLVQLKCQFDSPPAYANIECDICNQSYTDNSYSPVLATVYPKPRKYSEHFRHIIYIQVNTHTIDKIRISIRGRQCIGQTHCVLHFKYGTLEKSFPYDGKG